MIGPDAVKTSAGALNILPVCRENSLVKAVQYLKNSGVQVLASDLKAERQLSELDLVLPTAIIVGSEGKGTSPALIEEANQHFIIPQKGETDSLNVSVATGIMLYEVAQQRRKK
jgi:23S rRNA (guanosine2251-2'-O)-methyltransferase